MNDSISRAEAIDVVRKCPIKEVTPAYMLINKAEVMTGLMMLSSAQSETCAYWDRESNFCALHRPSAQPKRNKGQWIVTSEFEDCRYAKCNQCKVTQVFYYNKPLTNFCPNCGADMRGEQE